MASKFVDEYVLLLIEQYFNQPNARAETETTVGLFEPAFDVLRDFPSAFDVDLAVGDALDKIGKIVGVPRTVPLVISKIAFGFVDNVNSRQWADKFGPSNASPFYDKFTPPFTDQQLNDPDYHLLIKAKIAVNNCATFISSDDRISIQDVIQEAFNGKAYVVDKKGMKLWLYISPVIDLDRLRLLTTLSLLPKPQGVRYDFIIQAEPGTTFGFHDNAIGALGFGNKFGLMTGKFANKVIL